MDAGKIDDLMEIINDISTENPIEYENFKHQNFKVYGGPPAQA